MSNSKINNFVELLNTKTITKIPGSWRISVAVDSEITPKDFEVLNIEASYAGEKHDRIIVDGKDNIRILLEHGVKIPAAEFLLKQLQKEQQSKVSSSSPIQSFCA